MSKGLDSASSAENAVAEDQSVDVTSSSLELRVTGMDCASCAAAIESAVRRLDGVDSVRVDVVGGRVVVERANKDVTRRDVARAIRHVGYRVDDDDAAAAGARTKSATDGSLPSFWDRRGRLIMTGAAGGMLALAVVANAVGLPAAIATTLLATSTVAAAWYVVPRGLRAVRHRALDMNFLMSVAAAGAWVIGEPTEAAATLFLFAVAELLESYSMDRARNAIKALMDLSPAEATVERDGREQRVPAADVAVREIVVVRPGEKIAVDGDVVTGNSSVNQAAITGESMPVDKIPGDAVFAGSLNGQGALRLQSTKPASDTTLARILHAVEEAQASRAPSQRFVDRFARVYTPTVVGIALLIAVLPPLLAMGTWETWIYRALAMLVVACPCALVISTPVSIVSGLTGAARAGVLMKGGAHLENAGRVTVVAFDKTGTLTRGEPAVTDVVPLGRRGDGEVLSLALGVERHSEHPLARAILAEGNKRGLKPPPSTDFEALIGRGARATVGIDVVFVGNERLADDIGATSPTTIATLRRFESQGKTAVVVSTVGQVFGVIAIADQVRPEVAGALSDLRRMGIRRTIMLTGDNLGTARAVAESLGVTEYHAGLLPDEKVGFVRELEASGERVAFVGDGVNDAPALAAATVGVAMGAAGTDLALETADIALMSDDLSKLSVAMRLSHKTLQVIRQNIAFAILVKAVFLVLAIGGWATLWMAVAADMGASLVVVANGLRVLRVNSGR